MCGSFITCGRFYPYLSSYFMVGVLIIILSFVFIIEPFIKRKGWDIHEETMVFWGGLILLLIGQLLDIFSKDVEIFILICVGFAHISSLVRNILKEELSNFWENYFNKFGPTDY